MSDQYETPAPHLDLAIGPGALGPAMTDESAESAPLPGNGGAAGVRKSLVEPPDPGSGHPPVSQGLGPPPGPFVKAQTWSAVDGCESLVTIDLQEVGRACLGEVFLEFRPGQEVEYGGETMPIGRAGMLALGWTPPPPRRPVGGTDPKASKRFQLLDYEDEALDGLG